LIILFSIIYNQRAEARTLRLEREPLLLAGALGLLLRLKDVRDVGLASDLLVEPHNLKKGEGSISGRKESESSDIIGHGVKVAGGVVALADVDALFLIVVLGRVERAHLVEAVLRLAEPLETRLQIMTRFNSCDPLGNKAKEYLELSLGVIGLNGRRDNSKILALGSNVVGERDDRDVDIALALP